MRPGRRHLVLLAVLPAVVVLAGCGSEEAPTRTIGILRAVPAVANEAQFREGLESGGVDPDDVRILPADPDDAYPDPEAATEAVQRWLRAGAELLVTLSTGSTVAADEVAGDVPILFLVNDPSAADLVADERRPEGNLTGTTYRVPSDRLFSLAAQAFGPLEEVGCIYPEDDAAAASARRELERGADALGIALRCVGFAPGGRDRTAASAAAELVAAGVDAIVPVNSPQMVQAFPELERALGSVHIPVLAATPWDFATLTLVPDSAEVYRQLGRQAARLLAGDPVADVPVQDPGRYLVGLDLRAATRMGFRVPPEVVERADEVRR